MKNITYIIAILVLFSTRITFGQETDKKPEEIFKLKIELRPRTEYCHGYKNLAVANQPPGVITNQRSRIIFDYTSKKMKTKLVLQDVRIWGNQKQLVANEDFATSVHEAWGEILFNDNISLKAGRMEIVYDDHRLFGNVGWAPQARTHDAAILKYTTKKIHFHIGGALYNENISNNFYFGPNAYKAIQFFHFNYKKQKASISFIFLNNGKAENKYSLTYQDLLLGSPGTLETQTTVYSQTFGTHIELKKDNLFANFNAYYQTGKNPADWAVASDSIPAGITISNNTRYKTSAKSGKKINAFDIALEVGYKSNYILYAAGAEYLSGNSFTMDQSTGIVSDNNNIENAFTPFYGTNHKFNGWMDYFYVGNHLNNIGLIDIYAKFIYKKDKFFLKFIPHYFMSAGTGVYVTTSGSSFVMNSYKGNLGTELDIWGGYKVGKGVKIQVGYSTMLPTKNMQALKLGNTQTQIAKFQNWAWVMLSFNPTLLKFEK